MFIFVVADHRFYNWVRQTQPGNGQFRHVATSGNGGVVIPAQSYNSSGKPVRIFIPVQIFMDRTVHEEALTTSGRIVVLPFKRRLFHGCRPMMISTS